MWGEVTASWPNWFLFLQKCVSYNGRVGQWIRWEQVIGGRVLGKEINPRRDHAKSMVLCEIL